MGAFTLYGTSTPSTLLTSAYTMVTAAGGTEVSYQTTITHAGSGTWARILPQGGAVTDASSIPSPNGQGWVFQPGAGAFATGNWQISLTLALAQASLGSPYVFIYTYSNGTYTNISGGGFTSTTTTAQAKTTYTLSGTQFGVSFGANDLLFVQLLWQNSNPNPGGDNPTIYLSSSATQGVAGDLQITTPAFTPQSVTTLILYGTPTSDATLTTAADFATTTLGSSANNGGIGTGVSGSGWVEAYTQVGTGNASAAVSSLPAPSGHGYIYQSTALEGWTIAAGTWTFLLTAECRTADTAYNTITVRAYKYNSGTYTAIGTASVSNQAIPLAGLASLTFTMSSVPAVSFTTGDRLYLDIWFQFTGTWSANQALRMARGGQATTELDLPPVWPSGQVGVSIAGNTVVFDENSFQLHDKIDERQRFQCTVEDYAGTATYSRGQQVVVNDPTMGTLFSGVIADDKKDKSNVYPDPTIEHQIDTVGNEYFADKRTSNRQYTSPTYACKIVGDMVSDVLSVEGVVAPLAQQFLSTQADFAAGTLTSVVSTTNVGDGDLELASGTSLSASYVNASDWASGTFTNAVANSGGDISLSAVTRNWNNGSTANQTIFGDGSGTQSVKNGVFQLTCTAGEASRSRLDFAGTWVGAYIQVDLLLDEDTSKHSLEYGTTNWNYLDSYAYAVEVTTSQIELRIGSNGANSTTSSLALTTFAQKLAHGWYTLLVHFTGTSHVISLNGTQYISTNDSTYNQPGSIALRNRNKTSSTQTMQFDNFGVAALLTGSWQSAATSLTSIGTVASSVMTYDTSLSTGGTVSVQTSIDGGTTWQNAANGGVIPGLSTGVSASGKSLVLKVSFTATSPALLPDLKNLSWSVSAGYVASGTWTNAPLGYDTYQRANQAGWGTSSDGQTWSQVAGTDTLSISGNAGVITSNAGAANNRLLLGSKTGTSCEALARIVVGTGASAGIILCSDGTATNHYYARYNGTTQISISRRVSGTDSDLVTALSGLTLTNGVVIWMRFRVLNAGLDMRARLWLNGTSEPTTWQAVTNAPNNFSGQFGLYCSAAPTNPVSCTSFKVTAYPNPQLDLSPVGRLGSSVVSWNANLPSSATTLGVDISLDNGLTWTDASQQNGGPIPGLNGQPDPTVDGFGTNSSANYTIAYGYGGSTAGWTFDTTNSRVIATNGASAALLNNAITIANIDLFVDMDYSDAGGLVFCFADPGDYYALIVADNQAAIGTPNLMTLYRVSANVSSVVATGALSFVRGTYHRIRATNLDGVITCSFDGTTIITYTDNSPLGPGQCGLYQAGGVSASYDNAYLFGPALLLGTTPSTATTARYYQLWITPMGDNLAGKFLTTRLRLASTDNTKTPQVLDVTVGAYCNAIGVGALIPSADYRQQYLSKVFDDLIKQSNYVWWIDQSKALHFHAPTAVPAPWIVQSNKLGLASDLETDTNLWTEVRNDLYRNRQVLTGVIYTAAYANKFTGNSQATSFTLTNPVAPGTVPVITLNTVPQVVRKKGLTGAQWYYADSDPVIAQDSTQTVLTSSDTLVVTYTGTYIAPLTVDNAVAQAALALKEGGSGIVEAVEDVSKRNMTVAAATTYANQLLTRYCLEGRTINFATYRNGLQVGQVLNVFLPEKGIVDVSMLILAIDATVRQQPGGTVVYQWVIQASETPNPGSWQRLLASGITLT